MTIDNRRKCSFIRHFFVSQIQATSRRLSIATNMLNCFDHCSLDTMVKLLYIVANTSTSTNETEPVDEQRRLNLFGQTAIFDNRETITRISATQKNKSETFYNRTHSTHYMLSFLSLFSFNELSFSDRVSLCEYSNTTLAFRLLSDNK